MTQQIDQLESLLGPAIEALGLGIVLWGVEFQAGDHRAMLRLYVDAIDRHVGIEDCEAASREVSALLDVHDPVPGNYVLEVSSPGFDRPLFKAAQFAAFIGETVKITLAVPTAGRRRAHGKIVRVEGDTVVIDVDGVEHSFDHSNIQKARLVPQFDPPAKPTGKAPGRRPARDAKTSTSAGTA
ncbi:MAG: ribosome maturation factor RimP [Pseudomarimonas sp.]